MNIQAWLIDGRLRRSKSKQSRTILVIKKTPINIDRWVVCNQVQGLKP